MDQDGRPPACLGAAEELAAPQQERLCRTSLEADRRSGTGGWESGAGTFFPISQAGAFAYLRDLWGNKQSEWDRVAAAMAQEHGTGHSGPATS